MPHIIVKMYPGRTEETKKELVQKIIRAVVETAGCEERVVSVAIEEVAPENWTQQVYLPDIIDRPETIYRQPGYDPFKTELTRADSESSQLPAGQEKDTTKASLTTFVRGAAKTAEKEDTTGTFNPMSWLDLELEDRPESFDPFFDMPWVQLSEDEQFKRMADVRSVL